MSLYINGTDYCPICKVYDSRGDNDRRSHSPDCNMGIVVRENSRLRAKLDRERLVRIIKESYRWTIDKPYPARVTADAIIRHFEDRE